MSLTLAEGEVLKSYFRVSLSLRHPSYFFEREVDFRNQTDDLSAAERSFNMYYENGTRPMIMKVAEVNKDSIEVLLLLSYYHTKQTASGRDLSYFSKRLYHDYEWHRYSSIQGKLFKTDNVTEITEDEFRQAPFLSGEPSEAHDVSVDTEAGDSDNMLPTDKQTLVALQSLMDTQGIGTPASQKKKREAIFRIKQIIMTTV